MRSVVIFYEAAFDWVTTDGKPSSSLGKGGTYDE